MTEIPIKQEQVFSQKQALDQRILVIFSLIGVLGCLVFVPLMTKWGEQEIEPGTLIFNRYWISLMLIMVWSGVKSIFRFGQKEPIPLPKITKRSADHNQMIFLLVMTALMSNTTTVLWTWSLTQTTIANSALMHNLTPLFTIVVGWLLFNQQFEQRFLLGTAIAISGTIIIGVGDFDVNLNKIQGDLIALVSAGAWAGYLMSAEQLKKHLNTEVILILCFGMGTIITGILNLLTHEPLLLFSSKSWLACSSLAVFGQCLSQIFMLYTLKHIPSYILAVILLLEPVLSGFLAWVIFGEVLNLVNLIGFIIIVLGLYVVLSTQLALKPLDENS